MKKQTAIIYVIVVLLLWSSAFAQDALTADATAKNAATGSAAAVVTATIIDGIVRVASPGEIVQMRLQIYAAAGESIYDSGARQGGVIDLRLSDAPKMSADGTYLCVVTIKGLNNQSSQKLGVLTVQNNQTVIKRTSESELTPVLLNALVAARQTDKIKPAAAADGLTVLRDGSGERAVTVTAHDGRNGQVTSTSGALTFRTGNFFFGRELERMRITEDGRVGVNTTNPQATLDVAGTVRAQDGIVFADGSILKSASGLGAQQSFQGSAIAGINAAGTGTANRLAKWTDNAGTLGDSAISEFNNNLVINGGNIQMTATPNANIDSNVLFTDSNSKTAGIIASSTPAFLAANGSYMALRGNNYTLYPNQRGLISFSAGNVASPVGNDGSVLFLTGADQLRMLIKPSGNVGIGTDTPTARLDVAGNLKISGAGNALIFPDGTSMTTAGGGGGSMSGSAIVSAVNDAATVGVINDNRLSSNLGRLNGANSWAGANVFNFGLSANNSVISNVGNPANAGDAVNKSFFDANAVRFAPGAAQISVGDANGTFPMINLRGGSTCCSGPGGYTAADFKVFQNGSFVATGNLGIGVSPMEGKGYRTSWYTYKGAFRSGYADNEWDDANTGFFSWAGGSNSTASGLYSFAFGDTNFASSTSSIVFGSGNEVKGAAGFAAGAGNRVCDTYGVAFGNKAISGGPLVNGKCDPDSFNNTGLAAVAIGYNVTADRDYSTAMGRFASSNGFSGTFVWSDASAQASADTFKNTANNEFALRATGGFRFRTNLAGTTGCNLPAGSGVFNCTSSRYTKENFSLVKGADVLSSLRKIPVSSWNYISEGQSVRHLGPMAEDFFAQFKLGVGNTSIGIQDLAGVSIAAVKELDAQLQQKNSEVEKLQTEVNQLRATQTALEKRLEALEQAAKKENK